MVLLQITINLSSRPERSVVERSQYWLSYASAQSGCPTLCALCKGWGIELRSTVLLHPPQICHLDRSAAQWRDPRIGSLTHRHNLGALALHKNPLNQATFCAGLGVIVQDEVYCSNMNAPTITSGLKTIGLRHSMVMGILILCFIAWYMGDEKRRKNLFNGLLG